MIEAFDVLNRWTGAVQFTAQIDCAPDATVSMKLGLAVVWGAKNKINMAGANVAGAYMEGANMEGANVAGANVAGCKGADMDSGRAPIQLYGLRWPVTITDSQMRIGCQLHAFSAWRDFSPAQIRLMDSNATAFWKAHKATLFALIEGSGRTV